MIQKARKIALAQRFVHGHGHRVGQIQTARGVPHGQAHAGGRMFAQQPFSAIERKKLYER